jgi:hypothetical protein
MSNRSYNKLFVSKNREEGSDKILLGYQYDEKEIVIPKDKETYFHIPLYASPKKLVDTNLINSGAVAGIFPAASDRIFKSLKDYGNVTPYGSLANTFDSTGLWFCSWLKVDQETGQSKWMDRFYNPGKFVYDSAKEDLNKLPTYEKHDPIFHDVPSKMVLEPGVLYKYFHVGESTMENLVATFSGVSGENLGLHLLNWDKQIVDASQYAANVIVNSDAPSDVLYTKRIEDSNIYNPTINFDNTFDTSAGVEYLSSYNPETEFTWSFWGYSENWQATRTTQLLGNISTEGGGIGLFVDTLDTFPFIVIPETKYGHLLFLNESGEGYMDKAVNISQNTLAPACFAIDSENNVIVCSQTRNGLIYKTDHTGRTLISTKNINDRSLMFVFPFVDEVPKQMLCGSNDDIYIITNKGYYIFDKNLKLTRSVPRSGNLIGAFSYSLSSNETTFELVSDVYDVKFVATTKWSLSISNGSLYRDDVLVKSFSDTATNLAISPDDKLWVLHGTNNVTIIDTKTLSSESFSVGTESRQAGSKKTITFVKKYTRKTNTTEWRALIFYSDEAYVYFSDLTGKVKLRKSLLDLIDYKFVQTHNQSFDDMEFLANGDPSGYERNRIFNTVYPIYNEPQLKLRVSYKDLSKQIPTFRTSVVSASIKDWNLKSWQHVALTFKNKTFKLYVNAQQISELSLQGNHALDYSSQPSLFIGTPLGNKVGLNKEIRYTSNIFNGKIGDIRVFNYCIEPYNIKSIVLASTKFEDIYWSINMPNTQYVEQIDRFFKHKLPGSKSQFFNIKLYGTQITDSVTQKLIEKELMDIVTEHKPIHADLLKVKWIN